MECFITKQHEIMKYFSKFTTLNLVVKIDQKKLYDTTHYKVYEILGRWSFFDLHQINKNIKLTV